MTPREFQEWLEGVPAEIAAAARRAVREASGVAAENARLRSLGPYSMGELAKLDHPFARRHGKAKQQPAEFNIQSGEVARSWTLQDISDNGDLIEGGVFNTSGHALYLYDPEFSEYPDGGTDLMLGRDVPGAVMADTEREFFEILERELSRVAG